MAERALEDARCGGACLLLLVFFLVFLVIIVVDEIAVFAGLVFFFVIDFGGTFGTTDHGSTLRTVFAKWGYEKRAHHRAAYYIPRGRKSTPVHGSTALDAMASQAEGPLE